MPTNVTEFAGVCYAVAFRVTGAAIVVLGTHRADRAGVRAWLAATGHPRFGADLTPAAGTAPGFYVKPFVADVYYRIDPATGAAVRDSTSAFDNAVPVTARNGFGRPGIAPRHRRQVMKYTGVALVMMGAVIAALAGLGSVRARPDAVVVTAFLAVVAAGSAVAGAAVVAFGGRGYVRLGTAVA